MAVPPDDHRIRRGRAVAALVRMGWTPPTPRGEWGRRLIEDMERIGNHGQTLGLSRREVQHLRLAAKGITEAQMARLLDLSPETVKARSKIIRRKLGARSTTHAVAIALREGVID